MPGQAPGQHRALTLTTQITAAVQDRVFAELLRVLRPGGILVGSEGYDNERTRLAHAGDQFVPVDPDG